MLAALLNIPRNQNDWNIFSFHNRDQISLIRQAVLAQKNITLTDYQLDPINFAAFDQFLQNNQQAHTDFNNALSLQSSDLENMDPKDERQLVAWVFLGYQELYTASAVLKI